MQQSTMTFDKFLLQYKCEGLITSKGGCGNVYLYSRKNVNPQQLIAVKTLW